MPLNLDPDAVVARLGEQERRWVLAFREQLGGEFGDRLADLRLYGSRLRGDANDESDVDLLVLIKSWQAADSETVSRIAWSINLRLLPQTRDFDQYHSPASRASGFYEEMRTQSAKL